MGDVFEGFLWGEDVPSALRGALGPLSQLYHHPLLPGFLPLGLCNKELSYPSSGSLVTLDKLQKYFLRRPRQFSVDNHRGLSRVAQW